MNRKRETSNETKLKISDSGVATSHSRKIFFVSDCCGFNEKIEKSLAIMTNIVDVFRAAGKDKSQSIESGLIQCEDEAQWISP